MTTADLTLEQADAIYKCAVLVMGTDEAYQIPISAINDTGLSMMYAAFHIVEEGVL